MIKTKLESHIEELVRQDAFSGTVLAAKDGEPILRQAYGFAHHGYKLANEIDTKYNIGSCTKMFTALGVVQLAQKGKIDLNEPVRAYLPDYPREIAEKVTIHHLLTHTSGMVGSVLNEKTFSSHKDKVRITADWLALITDSPLLFGPGTSWSYSNAGFVVLAAIIERVSGMPYFDYLHESIWNLAGMHNTDGRAIDEDLPKRAMGYMNREAEESSTTPRRNNLPFALIRGNGHTGAWSTVEDLLSFSNAVRENTLLDPVHTDLLLAPKVATRRKEGEHYAYGFFVEEISGHWITGHGGIVAGFNAWFDVYSDLGFTVIILANYSYPAAEHLGRRVREWLLQG